jgi:hypothetical protein
MYIHSYMSCYIYYYKSGEILIMKISSHCRYIWCLVPYHLSILCMIRSYWFVLCMVRFDVNFFQWIFGISYVKKTITTFYHPHSILFSNYYRCQDMFYYIQSRTWSTIYELSFLLQCNYSVRKICSVLNIEPGVSLTLTSGIHLLITFRLISVGDIIFLLN